MENEMKVIILVIIGIVASAGIGASAYFGAAALGDDSEELSSTTASAANGGSDQVSNSTGADSTEPRYIGGQKTLMMSGPDGSVSSTIKTLASPDLPPEDPVTVGVFKSSEDNTLILGEGPLEIELNVEVIGDGQPVPVISISNFGPDVEVVIPVGAVIYRDVTETPSMRSGNLKPGDNIIPQQLKVISDISDIADDTIISVWGDKRGDRVVADVIVLKVESGGF